MGSKLHEKIKPLRKLRGMKQYELAKKLKIGRAYLSLIEKGKRNPSIELMEQIFNELDCELKVIIN